MDIKSLREFAEGFQVSPGKDISLKKDFDPGYKGDFFDKQSAADALEKGVSLLNDLQSRLYAQGRQSVLIILQAMDAAGKDSTIKHVMSGLNPQGCQVTSFKSPSAEELSHGFLWRCAKAVPPKGFIGIFNRSYYEEVLVTKVHPEILSAQKLPTTDYNKSFWNQRYEQINNFEDYLNSTGTKIIKFFLNVSAAEQKKRFEERLEEPDKNWKFSPSDMTERQFWPMYQSAFEDMLNKTSTKKSPWYVIPADHKWFTRLAVAGVIIYQMQLMNPQYPEMSSSQREKLAECAQILADEKK